MPLAMPSVIPKASRSPAKAPSLPKPTMTAMPSKAARLAESAANVGRSFTKIQPKAAATNGIEA